MLQVLKKKQCQGDHVSTRAADIEIAARLTTIYICNLDNGTDALSADRRRRALLPLCQVRASIYWSYTGQ